MIKIKSESRACCGFQRNHLGNTQESSIKVTFVVLHPTTALEKFSAIQLMMTTF